MVNQVIKEAFEFVVFVRDEKTPRVVFEDRDRVENAIQTLIIPEGFNSLDEVYAFFKDFNIERTASGNTFQGWRVEFKIIIKHQVSTIWHMERNSDKSDGGL